ncbi:MAG: hypothetical protein HZB65_02255 [Candidatus Aenigmarchaeota archaeon]|nr:hypothetical protein [Candidatus Aenigmarchaeota archaeon]
MTFSESHSSCQGKKYYTFHYKNKLTKEDVEEFSRKIKSHATKRFVE